MIRDSNFSSQLGFACLAWTSGEDLALAEPVSAAVASQNRLLGRLSADDLQSLLPHLQYLELPVPASIFEAERPIEWAYFPLAGLFSMVRQMENGDVIEVAALGKEGAVGTQVLLGQMTLPYRCFIQIDATALRVSIDTLRRLTTERPSLLQLLLRYQGAVSVQIMQNSACNGLHGVAARCCRWLLMTGDRLSSDHIPLTHEFLGQMLGVRRAGVSEVLKPLRDQGLIDYARGSITLLDREELRACACECYGVITDEFNAID
jgi:CRP-like cAMP-binding protein